MHWASRRCGRWSSKTCSSCAPLPRVCQREQALRRDGRRRRARRQVYARRSHFALCTLHFARSSHEDYGPFRTRDNGGCYELINVRGRVKLYKIMSC